MNSLGIEFLDKLSFSSNQVATIGAIREHKGKQDLYQKQSPEILKRLLDVAVIESTESSTRLEGIIVPHKRIAAISLKSSAPRNRSEQEVAGYKDALNLLHSSAQHIPFSNNVILQLHSILHRYLPQNGGKWKNVDNDIVERNPDNSIRKIIFKPVSAFDTPRAMEHLIADFALATQGSDPKDPLIIIPLTILDFLCIHPFLDGNGRVARLLTLLLLYHFGFKVGTYISLERIIEESKDSYYQTLNVSSQGWHKSQHDVQPWLNYFWGALLRAYKEFEERVSKDSTGRGRKTQYIRNLIQAEIAPFAISDIQAQCPDISRDMIRLVIRKMRDEGLIESTGKGRSAKWMVKIN